MNIFRLMAIGGVVIGAGAMLDRLCSHHKHARKQVQLDDALDGTFPASDPTATQDFAIPVNRL
ncbi:MAG: hypothetical protein ABIP38_06000 [Steroidobacteraceae bacterium]